MCNRLTILAAEDPFHCISQCEHGSIHLDWGNLTIHLKPQNFLELSDILEAACARRSQVSGDKKKFHLNIQSAMLVLSSESLFRLRDLVNLSLDQMICPILGYEGINQNLYPPHIARHTADQLMFSMN